MIAELLKERNLPDFRSREEMIDLLLREEYGYFPDIPYEVSVSAPINVCGRYCDSIWMTNRKPRNSMNSRVLFIKKIGYRAEVRQYL